MLQFNVLSEINISLPSYENMEKSNELHGCWLSGLERGLIAFSRY